MSRFLSALFACLSVCLGTVPALAEDAGPLLAHEFVSSFEPGDVHVLIELPSGSALRLKAVVVAASGTPEASGERRYVAGTKLPAGIENFLRYSLLIFGRAQQFELIPALEYEVASQPEYLQSTDRLQGHIDERREVLSSLRVQIESQEESLRRLRQDAEVIGNFGRVNEVNEEVLQARSDIENAEKSVAALEGLIKGAGRRPAPRGAVAREGQLTRQLSELASAAKRVEDAEQNRKASMEFDLQRKLALVEASRYDSFDELQRRLAVLRDERRALEQRAGVAAPAEAGTPAAVSTDVDY